MTDKKTGLELLREPFPAHQISKLPKPTKRQTDEIKADFKKGIRCRECGQWHHPDVIHLDYVGHAALTDRLLDCDSNWNWQPLASLENGAPAFDSFGGMWIQLTVCGVTRLGYGHPDGKQGGNAIKETIGDALRNAAMRFGAALDLWHKGDLHNDEDASAPESDNDVDETAIAIESLSAADNLGQLKAIWIDLPKEVKASPKVLTAKNRRKSELEKPVEETPLEAALDDRIPF